MAKDEAKLIAQAQRGERAAFVKIYERHYAAVYRYIFFRVLDEPLAQDITAEVFIRLVTKIQTFKVGKQTILAWLYTVARNLIIDHGRAHGRLQPLSDQQRNQPSGNPAHNPSQRLQRRMTQADLAAVLQQLTEEQQQVILLKFVEGWSNAAIGRELGKSEGAVKSLQHRALARMRRILTEEYAYDE